MKSEIDKGSVCVLLSSSYPFIKHSGSERLVRRGLDGAHDFELPSASGAIGGLLLVGDSRNCRLRIEDGIRHYPRELATP